MGIPFLPNHTTTNLITIMEKLSQQSAQSLSSNPLFSSIVTLYFLILLYFPQLFFNLLIISPLIISTLILLPALLRLGALQQQPSNITLVKNDYSHLQYQNQNNNHEPMLGLGFWIQPKIKPISVENTQTKEETNPEFNSLVVEPHPKPTKPDPQPETEPCDRGQLLIEIDEKKQVGPLQTSQCLSWAELSPNLFLEWEVSAPLEVIYEAFEGVEDGEEAPNDVFCDNNVGIMTCKYPTLSRYYPESDSDSDSDLDMDWDCSSDNEEEEREGLIEIALDYDYYDDKSMYNNNNNINNNHIIIKKPNDKVVDYEELQLDDEEDNLIEIDISPTKSTCDFSW